MSEPKGWTLVQTESLVPAVWNFKKDDDVRAERLREKLKAGVQKRGQIMNVIVRELDNGTLELVDGNHRLPVFRQLQMTEVMAFNLGAISQAEAELIALEIYELGFDADPLKLGTLLKDITTKMPNVDLRATLPYTEVEIDKYIKAAEFTWDKFRQTMPDDSPGVSGGKDIKIELNIPIELATLFKDQIKRCVTHEAAIRRCVDYLASLTDDTLRSA